VCRGRCSGAERSIVDFVFLAAGEASEEKDEADDAGPEPDAFGEEPEDEGGGDHEEAEGGLGESGGKDVEGFGHGRKVNEWGG